MGKSILCCLKKLKSGSINGQKGFTLLEVLAAVAILAAIGVTILVGMDTSSRSTGQATEKMIAGNLITEYFETIKGMPYAESYPDAGSNITIPFQYDVAVNISFSVDGTTWTEAYTTQTLQKISIAVSREGRPILSVCTLRVNK